MYERHDSIHTPLFYFISYHQSILFISKYILYINLYIRLFLIILYNLILRDLIIYSHSNYLHISYFY